MLLSLRLGLALLALLAFAGGARAGEADVIGVQARLEADGAYAFDVTVRHADTGWEHYADKWEILGPEGAVLATRALLHPHETEQPFTRSLDHVRVPQGVRAVRIRAHDKVHGAGGKEMTVALPGRPGS